MNADLEYLADSLFIEALAKDDSIIVLAQQDIVSNVASGIKDYISDIYDSKRPLASFMGDGLLWSMGFPWMSVLYAVAEALGFDWKSFWSSVGKGIVNFARIVISSGNKATQDTAGPQINDIVEASFENSFSGEVDRQKLFDLAKQNKLASDIRDAQELKALAIKLQKNPPLIKKASILSIFKGKLSRFFVRTISWLIKTALISLGFVSAAGAVSGLLGGRQESSEESSEAINLQVSPNAPPDMFEVHPNDMSRVWIERGDINTIDSLLKNWVVSIYPQLQSKLEEIASSSGYRSMLAKFRERNALATGLGMLSIPRPYQRKADVVSEIVSQYLREHPQKSTEQPGNNTIYK